MTTIGSGNFNTAYLYNSTPVFKARQINQRVENFQPKEDLSNNKKFDLKQACRNLWTGLKKPFKDVIKYAKEHPVQFALLTGFAIGATALAAGATGITAVTALAGYALTGLGLYFIGNPLVRAGKKVANAKNGDDYEKIFTDFGESATYAALTFVPKAIPTNAVNKLFSLTERGSKTFLNLWSNATDMASLGPRFIRK